MGAFDDLVPKKAGGAFDDLVPEQEQGGFAASAKRTIGQSIAGIGQAAADYIPGVTNKNPVSEYGKSIIEANPTAVTGIADIADKPWTAVKEATGNAAASIVPMIGARAAGMGITAASPLAGPFAPLVAGIGQAVSWGGPTLMAALPSYSGIREQQIRDNPQNNEDAKSKAIAALGAATIAGIETRFGPQNWALAAMKKGGFQKLAGMFASKSLAKNIGKGALKGAAIEGSEELVQNPIEQAASYQNPLTKESLQDTAFGGAMGAIGGGVLGGAGGGIGHFAGKGEAETANNDTPPTNPLLAQATQKVSPQPGGTSQLDQTPTSFDVPNTPPPGPLSGAVGIGRMSGAIPPEPVLRERDFVPPPSGSYGQLAEFENLLNSERADKQSRVSDLLSGQAMQAASEAESQQARVEAAQAQQSAQERYNLLQQVAETLPDGRNLKRAFGRALKEAGYSNLDFTPEETASIDNFNRIESGRAIQAASDAETAQIREESNPEQIDAQNRRAILLDVANTLPKKSNLKNAFIRALEESGYADVGLSKEEKATIDNFNHINRRDEFSAGISAGIGQAIAPSTRNEVSADQMGIREKGAKPEQKRHASNLRNRIYELELQIEQYGMTPERESEIVGLIDQLDKQVAAKKKGIAAPTQTYGAQPTRTTPLLQTATNLGLPDVAQTDKTVKTETKREKEKPAPAIEQPTLPPESSANPAVTPQQAQKGPGLSAPIKSYAKKTAMSVASMMTRNGSPTEAYPHPSGDGTYALRVPGSGSEATPKEAAPSSQAILDSSTPAETPKTEAPPPKTLPERVDAAKEKAATEKADKDSSLVGHKVGDLVKLTKPGVGGRVNIAGTIKKILPGGRFEIKTQSDGYMIVHKSELGHKPAAEVKPNSSATLTSSTEVERKRPSAPAQESAQQPAKPTPAETPKAETPEIVEHVTARGKTLRGIVRTDLTHEQAKALDKYTFKKNGGYFIRETPAENLKEAIEGKPESSPKAAEDKSKANAAKLRTAGEKIVAAAESDMGRDRLTNTNKRASQASHAEATAAQNKLIGETMIRIANAIEDGAAGALSSITSRTQVERLDSFMRQAKYAADRKNGGHVDQQRSQGRPFEESDLPFVEMTESAGWISNAKESLLKAIAGKNGAPALRDEIRYAPSYTPALDAKLKKILTAEQIRQAVGWYAPDMIANHSRMVRAGIENTAQLREAIKQYAQIRASKAVANKAKELERKLVGQKVGIDFFPTPKSVASDMVQKADIHPGMTVLEPSAGNGNIADAIKGTGVNPDVIELSSALREILEAKDYNVVGQDFMQAKGNYDRIVMNPPFSNRMDSEHVQHAYELLNPGGRVVAIMGEGVFFGQDKKAQAFREWLDSVGGTSEKLPAGTFNDKTLLATTGTNARLVVIDKTDNSIRHNVSDAWYYSALERHIDSLNTKSAPAQGWKDQIKGAISKGLVKAAEVEAVGIHDWLDLQQGRVSKDQVQQFLDQNGVKVEEVTLGADLIKPLQDKLDHINDMANAIMDKHGVTTQQLPADAKEEIYRLTAEHDKLADEISGMHPSDNATKFSGYQLPGGENYRELLLTLPSDTTVEDRSTAYYRETSNDFRSSHYDQANILAHVRFNERTDADGKRVLFLEELQSDFGQSFKKQKDEIRKHVDDDFTGIVDRMKKAGVLEVECD